MKTNKINQETIVDDVIFEADDNMRNGNIAEFLISKHKQQQYNVMSRIIDKFVNNQIKTCNPH